MFSDNNRISIRQLQLLLLISAAGTGLIRLPAEMSAFSGTDAWISAILAAAALMAAAYLIGSAAGLSEGKGFFDYMSGLLTRTVAVMVAALFFARLILAAASELRRFGEIIRLTLLRDTPFAAISLTMLAISAYSAAKGYEARARLAEMLAPAAFALMLLAIVPVAARVDYSNLLPAFHSPPEKLAMGAVPAVSYFTGLELCLIAFPYLRKREGARKGVVQSAALIGALIAVLALLSVARFGASGLKRQPWPVLEMTAGADSPGGVIERQDALSMAFWIVVVFAVVNAALFFSSTLIKDISGGRIKQKNAVLFCVPLIFGVSLLPEKAAIYGSRVNGALGAFFMFILPPLMIIAAKIKKRRPRPRHDPK